VNANSRPKSVPGRTRMLDAAEMLFAKNGFDGTSLREITGLAKVEVGLVTYHFRTKAELFRETILRRAPDLAGALNTALDEVLDGGGEPRSILEAYFGTHMGLIHSPEPGWRAYVRLAAESLLRVGKEELSSSASEIYRPVMYRYERALIDNLVEIPPGHITRVWAIFRRALLPILIGETDELIARSGFEAIGQTFVDIFARSLLPGDHY
jgi:AcrR family transcriptional regulator